MEGKQRPGIGAFRPKVLPLKPNWEIIKTTDIVLGIRLTHISHISLASFLWGIGKHNSPRWGYSVCFLKGGSKPNDNVYKKELYKTCIFTPVILKSVEKWRCGHLDICKWTVMEVAIF